MLRGHFREMFAADAPFRTFKTAFVRLLAVNKKEGKRWYDLLKISLLMINLWPSFLKNQLFFHYIIINCIKENRTRSYHLWPLTLVIYTKFSNTLIIQPLTTRRVLKTYKIDNIFYSINIFFFYLFGNDRISPHEREAWQPPESYGSWSGIYACNYTDRAFPFVDAAVEILRRAPSARSGIRTEETATPPCFRNST